MSAMKGLSSSGFRYFFLHTPALWGGAYIHFLAPADAAFYNRPLHGGAIGFAETELEVARSAFINCLRGFSRALDEV